jgi:thiol-disulfide isomerase/thioredoxin
VPGAEAAGFRSKRMFKICIFTRMKILVFIFFTFFTFAAMAQQPAAPVLTGTTDARFLAQQASCPWFNSTYESYKPENAVVAELKKALPADATFLVFGGAWCSDTQNLLPKFYKAADDAGIPREKIKLYLVDEQKNSPEKLEKEYGVTNVPAFIVLQNGRERGRVVETVQKSIEADLLKLLQKQ